MKLFIDTNIILDLLPYREMRADSRCLIFP